jgi:hypothetical protein
MAYSRSLARNAAPVQSAAQHNALLASVDIISAGVD